MRVSMYTKRLKRAHRANEASMAGRAHYRTGAERQSESLRSFMIGMATGRYAEPFDGASAAAALWCARKGMAEP